MEAQDNFTFTFCHKACHWILP